MRLAIIIFILVISLPTYSQIKQDSTTNIILNKILNLELDSAQTIINNYKSDNNYYINYLENYKLFFKSFISEEQTDFDNFEINSSNCLSYLESNDNKSEYNLLLQSDIKLKLAVNHLKFENYIKAFANLYSSYLLIKLNVKKYPDFDENNKLDGIFDVLLGNIPSNLSFIKNVFNLEGNIQTGIAKLSAYYNMNKNTEGKNQESLYILYYSSKNTLTRDLTNIVNNQKHNFSSPIYKYTLANHLAANNRTDSAIKVLETYKTTNSSFPLHIINYQLGIYNLSKLDAKAKIHLNNYVNNFKGKNYIKSAYQKLYWYSLIFENENRDYLVKLNNFGENFTDEDKQASNFNYQNINLRLLKARLLFDGGYYIESQQELLQNYSASYYKSINEKLEYIYRFARINHKLENIELAITYYKTVIEKGKNVELHFAANSALQLGLIYESKQDYTKANEYLHKCLELNNYEYKNSIEFKAKTVINRMSNY